MPAAQRRPQPTSAVAEEDAATDAAGDAEDHGQDDKEERKHGW